MTTQERVKEAVREKYAAVARAADQDIVQADAQENAQANVACCAPECCAPEAAQGTVAQGDLGLGCGHPTDHAGLQGGETVLDLGSGAGVDVFLAASKVGESGTVIGVDMTQDMIDRARANAVSSGHTNVEFRLGDIEALPVDSDSVDVVLSNCVINLVPDKRSVFAEIHRVLRQGSTENDAGRFVISDIVSYGAVPADIRSDLEQWTGCISGATDRDEYLRIVGEAGFNHIEVVDGGKYESSGGAEYGFESVTVVGRKA